MLIFLIMDYGYGWKQNFLPVGSDWEVYACALGWVDFGLF
jgi:hypothetical protein